MKDSTSLLSALLILIFAMLAIGKVTGYIDCTWWVVFTPLLLPFAATGVILALVILYMLVLFVVFVVGLIICGIMDLLAL